MERIDFRDQISRNKRNSFLLIFLIITTIFIFGYVIANVFGEEYFLIILIFATLLSIMYPLITYNFSAQIALASVNAKEIDPGKNRDIQNIVEGLAIASGLPVPKVYIMNSDQINAFASGKNPKNSVICLTKGAINKLERRELEAVIAHELSHIANYDILYITIVSVMVGMVSIISEIFLRSFLFQKQNDKKNNGLAIFGIIFAIFAPISVHLVQLAISRKREYAADATAVKFTRYPRALANALKKIKEDSKIKTKTSEALSPLFFVHPLNKITSTHPPIDQRIKILENM